MTTVNFEVGKKYYFGKKGFLAGGHWNYGDYGFYECISRTAKFVTIRTKDQCCIDEDTREMAYEIFRVKVHLDKRGNQEMTMLAQSIFAKNVHEDTPENNDISKW